MKIDLNNKVVVKLVKGADLADGCSVIRRVFINMTSILWEWTWIGFLSTVALFTVIGSALYLYSPWFSQLDIGLSMSWLGNSWWAASLRVGAGIGMIVTAFITVMLVLFYLFEAGPKAIGKTEAFKLIAEVTRAKMGKFCPTVSVILPVHLQNLTGKLIRLTGDEDMYRVGAPRDVSNGVVWELTLDPPGPEPLYDSLCKEYIRYYYGSTRRNSEFTVVNESPVTE